MRWKIPVSIAALILFGCIIYLAINFNLAGNRAGKDIANTALTNGADLKVKRVDCGATSDFATDVDYIKGGHSIRILSLRGDHSSDLRIDVQNTDVYIHYKTSELIDQVYNFLLNNDGLSFFLVLDK
jgi:hypothetical protein